MHRKPEIAGVSLLPYRIAVFRDPEKSANSDVGIRRGMVLRPETSRRPRLGLLRGMGYQGGMSPSGSMDNHDSEWRCSRRGWSRAAKFDNHKLMCRIADSNTGHLNVGACAGLLVFNDLPMATLLHK